MTMIKAFGIAICCGLFALIICIANRDVLKGGGVAVTIGTWLVMTAIVFAFIMLCWWAVHMIVTG